MSSKMADIKGNIEKELEGFLKEEPNIILDNFISEKLSVMSLLNAKNSSPQQMMMALELILKACESTNDPNLIAKFLCQLAACKDCLIIAVSVLVGVELTTTNSPGGSFLETVLNLFQVLVQRVPTISMDILEILLPQLSEVWKKQSGGEHILSQLEKLEKQKETFIALRQNTEKSSKPSAAVPFDFRRLPDIPSIEEMLSGKPFLRPAIVSGPYSDVEQYLDIQFRLSREDMFHDFRKCLNDFHLRETSENGRLYHNAYIDKVEQTNNGTLLYFVVPVRSKVDWKTTKRLSPGSLLCLSCDEFKTFYFGSIRSRKDDGHDGNICYVALSFEPTKEPEYFLNFYTIIEAGGYYESYKHIFENLRELTFSFPFKNCLLDYKGCDFAPFPLDHEKELRLRTFQSKINDENQNQAFELALRNKIALIQGPPGTGKSYLGVQIVRYLTQIADVQKPVIVMCYTNHALDQFLEKMLAFTKKVVRIGSRSKSQELEIHNLSNLTSKQNYDLLNHEKNYPDACEMFEDVTIDTTDPSFEVFREIYGDRMVFDNYPKTLHCKVRQGCGIISESLNNCLNKIKFPFTKTTMDVRLCDIHGLHDAYAKGELKGTVFNTVLHTADKIKLHQWLMTDKPFSQVYDEMTDFKKMLTEELLDSFQLRKALRKIYYASKDSKVDTLAELLIRLCIKHEPNSLLLQSASTEDVEHFVRCLLFSDELVFPLFLRAAVRCEEKNGTVVNEDCSNLWLLDIYERWKLLSDLLVKISKINIRKELRQISRSLRIRTNSFIRKKHNPYIVEPFEIGMHEEYCLELKDNQATRNAHFLKGADIIGITTTGAAKNFDLLKKISATTYIVEEAAEVFESSIVASLTPDIGHLVLIGDHFQLRPSPTVYNLATKNHLDVSLFERLFKNGAPSACLQVQHRMRPSIARLLVPDFYCPLDNHPSVLEYENVAGMSSNVFFLQHSELENEDDGLKSHSNSYEAFLIVALCEYLISQGNDPCSITILTTYVGQMHLIRKSMQQGHDKNVLVTTVDNYQGEENEIILLSFVRSNIDNTVGFIKTHNRLCVALSRARKGLYCVGNFNMLASQSEIWQSLLINLQNMGSFGEKLAVNCSRHPEIKSLVGTPFDFELHMKKGCNELCNKTIRCGHACSLLCHEKDIKHTGNQCNTKCKKAIAKLFPLSYSDDEAETDDLNNLDEIMDSLSNEDETCSDDFHNESKSQANFPYITDKPTADSDHNRKNIDEVKFPILGESEVTEGNSNVPSKEAGGTLPQSDLEEIQELNKSDQHEKQAAPNSCPTSKNEVTKCDGDVTSKEADDTLAQNNSKEMLDLDKSDLNKKNEHTKILSCGHVMILKKDFRHWGFSNPKCQEIVVSQMTCGETINHVCGEQADHPNCSAPLLLKCGHTAPCNTKINPFLSMIKCMVGVEVTLSCSHQCKIPCFKKNSLYMIKCKQECGSLLPCHHACLRICSDCSVSGKHSICTALVKKPMPCGHILETECSTPFPYCNQRCLFRCVHTRCINPCYIACFPCQRPCTWNCEHYRCDKLCNETCDRPPCDEPCKKLNPSCGHPCSGFCGEPCPAFCQLCNQGDEANNEKFILLEDCGHCIPYIELSDYLKKHKFLNCPKCPKCKAPITKSVRFGNVLKSYYKSRIGNEFKSLIGYLPVIQFFQPYISGIVFEEHVKMLWNELQKERLSGDKNYVSKLKVVRQLHVLFCVNEFQKHRGRNEEYSTKVLYDSLKANEISSYDAGAEIFRIGASLFIQKVITTENMFSKVGQVNEMCEDIENCFETSPFNNKMVEVVQEMVKAVNHLNCPTLSAFIEFLKELQSAIA